MILIDLNLEVTLMFTRVTSELTFIYYFLILTLFNINKFVYVDYFIYFCTIKIKSKLTNGNKNSKGIRII